MSFLSLNYNLSVWSEIDTKQSLHTLLYHHCSVAVQWVAGWDSGDLFFLSQCEGVDGLISNIIETVMGIKSAIMKDN